MKDSHFNETTRFGEVSERKTAFNSLTVLLIGRFDVYLVKGSCLVMLYNTGCQIVSYF